MNKFNIKQIVIIVLIIVVIGIVVVNIRNYKDNALNIVINEPAQEENGTEIFNLCYSRFNKTGSGLVDGAWLKLKIQGEKISGEFHNLPAEKDSKVGLFEGTVGPLDQKIMARRANVWWNSQAEGMEVKEELAIEFGDGSATVGFGEMVDRGDGVYVYKDKNNLYYIDQMNQVDCENLEEKLFAEKYVRDNISTMATNKAVLGGTWYVTSVIINPQAKTGEVSYEDGHILSKANITYTYEKNPQKIVVTKFLVSE